MKTKDQIIVITVSSMMVSWLYPPMNESPRFFYEKYKEKPIVFNGFHFVFSRDPYYETRVLNIDWAKLAILNLVIFTAGSVCYYVSAQKNDR